MVEHLPCKASHELVRQGFWDFINGIAQNGGPCRERLKELGTSFSHPFPETLIIGEEALGQKDPV